MKPARPGLHLLLYLMLCLSFPGLAQQTEAPPETEATAGDTAASLPDSEALQNLLETLESDTARQEFTDNLRTLIETQQAEQQDAYSFSQLFGIDQTSTSLMSNYMNTLNGLGIDDSLLGRLVLLLIALIIVLSAIFINRLIASRLDRRADSLRRRLLLSEKRLGLFFRIQIWFGYLLGSLLLAYSVMMIFDLLSDTQGRDLFLNLVQFAFTALFISLLVALIWELANGFMEYGVNEKSSLNTARMRTLLPVVRNVVLFIALLMMAMVLLSELGVDIIPLMAGAGVLGIALGFGAQTMVKDFLTGFVIILEDLLQVGDVVEISGCMGEVEMITLRKIQLRSLEGTVHTIPHSEISIIGNYTKEYSYYLFNVGVAYKEDVDEVIACLRDVDEDMNEDDVYGKKIITPLEIMGVDEFADSAVVIKARVKTIAHQRWAVGREFNRRIKYAFDERGIEIPFPHQTVYFGQQVPVSMQKAEEDSV